jgi:hypothetical protein
MRGADALQHEVAVGVAGQNQADGFGKALENFGEQFGAIHAGHAHV